MSQEKLSDERLLELYRSGDQEALEQLLEKYKNMVRSKTRTYFLIGADQEDLAQEGMIGLFKAIRYYDPHKEAGFYSFAELCITRQMITAVKSANRQKHQPLNAYVSLNKSVYGDNEETDRAQMLAGEQSGDPESLLIIQENLDKIYGEIETRLSQLEKRVLRAYLDGGSYVQIAQELGLPAKSVDNALQRIKKKLEDI